tara:strand:- start:122 stop:835 length:714 start_codon:yes stop_codon:yes gene_type:complete
MHDIALSVGATYFSQSTGDDLSLMTFKDLGRASKVIVGKDSTIILKDDKKVSKEDIDKRVEELRDAHKITKKKADKDFIMSRIASLTGGVGVIYVGGNTDLEQKELYDRVDDAVCAVRSAIVEGILPGGGLALWEAAEDITDSKSIAHAILGEALSAPLNQILSNAGIDWSPNRAQVGQGLDVKSGKTGDMIEMGIIDPLKVTRTALQNAVSVATTILSTNAIVTMARSYEQKNIEG